MPRTKQFDEAAVLTKAMHLFWEKGYHATSVSDLVQALGINRASLYDTFGDKQQLFERAFTEYRAINRERIQAVFNQHESVRAGLEALLLGSLEAELSTEQPRGCFAVNLSTQVSPKDDRLTELLFENQRFFEKVFAEYLQKGVEQGELSKQKDLAELASYLYTLYAGTKVIARTHPDPVSLGGIVQTGLRVLDH